MKKYFLTDIDNCTLDWSGAMLDYLRDDHSYLDLDPSKYSFGLSDIHMDQLWRQFNKEDRFERLKPLRDAAEYLPKIADLGYTFIGITSCLPDATPETYAKLFPARMKNLQTYFGDIFEYCVCLQVHDSKKPFLEKYSPTFWVDDKLKHVEDGAKVGHQSFLMAHDYNVALYYNDFTRVDNWKEIYETVLQQSRK